jgi:hypothetical protein
MLTHTRSSWIEGCAAASQGLGQVRLRCHQKFALDGNPFQEQVRTSTFPQFLKVNQVHIPFSRLHHPTFCSPSIAANGDVSKGFRFRGSGRRRQSS